MLQSLHMYLALKFSYVHWTYLLIEAFTLCYPWTSISFKFLDNLTNHEQWNIVLILLLLSAGNKNIPRVNNYHIQFPSKLQNIIFLTKIQSKITARCAILPRDQTMESTFSLWFTNYSFNQNQEWKDFSKSSYNDFSYFANEKETKVKRFLPVTSNLQDALSTTLKKSHSKNCEEDLFRWKVWAKQIYYTRSKSNFFFFFNRLQQNRTFPSDSF